MKKVFCEDCKYIYYNQDTREWECWSPLNHRIRTSTNPTWLSENMARKHEFAMHPSDINDGNMCEFFKEKEEPINDR